MFHFDRTSSSAGDWFVVDETREAEFRRIRNYGDGRERYFAYRLTTPGRNVPLMAHQTFRGPGYKGPEWTFTDFGRVGPYPVDGIPEYKFESATERSELLLLATEALLVYDTFMFQNDLPADYLRVHAEVRGKARTLSLSDFGYDATEPIGPN